MNLGRTVFSQLISFLPDREFRRCVSRYDGDRRWRGFSCWDQFLCMAFAQLTYRESLRDIEVRSAPSSTTWDSAPRWREANELRRIYADFAQVLIPSRGLCTPAIRSAWISIKVSSWTRPPSPAFRFPSKFRRKAAVKMHTRLRGKSPRLSALPMAKRTTSTSSTSEVMDRAYVDFERLFDPLLVVLRRANQEEHLAPTALLASRRQVHGDALGSPSY